MADSVVIREFLVALGFKVDEKGLKNFKEGVEGTTKGVKQLIATVSGAALTVSAGVAAFASKLERLYFVAQRTGAAETSLKSLEFAARNFGVSSEQAIGTVENLARMLRNVPGSEGLLQQMGVQTRDANGKLRDSVDLLTDLGSQLAKLPQYEANAYGGVFGIDENLLLAMRNGDFDKYVKQYREMSQSTGLDKASSDAHKFMVSLRGLGTSFENLGIRVEGAMLQKIGPQLERFQRWMDEHGEEIANRITDVATAVVNAAAAMAPVLAWLADKFVELDRGTDGWSTKILLLGLALKALGVFKIARGIWKIVGALRAGGFAASGATGLLSAMGLELGALASSAAAVGAAFLGWKIGDGIRDQIDGLITKLSGGRFRSLWDILTLQDRSGLDATGGYTQAEIDSMKDQGGAKLTAPRGAQSPAAQQAPAASSPAVSASGGVAGAMERLADTAFGKLIARGEGDYNSVNRGARGGYRADTENLEGMTLAQVMAAQRAGQFNAAGRYQIIGDTLSDAASALKLNGSEMFDRKLQDRIFSEYLVRNKRRSIADYVEGRSDDLRAALRAASREWASVADPDTGRSYYAGKGNNRASITAAEMEAALRNTRATYQQPPTAAAQMVNRGEASRSVEVKQDVRIEVNGVNDPAAAGREVARHQAQVANDMAREMRGVIA
ncbi:mannosyl-glycoprotein endo-beta-N-acetylglucosamidase [Burkholderia contaminans FFH2055]|uniref:mannosyl-glycoprotein endo-beta-N-acetylglucosamidase n=1 Tax=Burkholderia contaminans TaxID=488447 RepID=UPI0006251F9E|nr:mannosyl-glycoprotein endo-beta-N-acetylglucosamidase [Burkholderia contaminans]KKL38620.1 mannosyl-glycoprotein endo-beta-N-acetylglucosamidase [Burkholderia contaminans FFH2055]MEB4631167.1 mannosyl-glycoprotein endo-beta-N-acetylglucosamidase [Burkholderia contaminans]MEB4637985.1 mannosyl-glycoprotein endo-beta-N-acetylglucosamidase [Burkholderia contaminans]MEB4653069.1 mannosyl-glycoprotein endo-beta-N-acetylglucosamidase [Burkholderia contaminans]MEB4658105.1 mannosyl-glycoprotein en